MNAEWLSDFRKIPDEVMNYLRRIAVRAVEDQHQSPELIAKIFGISRSCIMTGCVGIIAAAKRNWIPDPPRERPRCSPPRWIGGCKTPS